MYSETEKQKFLEDLLDPDKVQVYCKDHMYFGPIKIGGIGSHSARPGKGCAKCWFVYYLVDLARTPANQRQERLDELEEVIHHVVEAVENGTWDFEPLEHAEIQIEKDVN